MLKCLAAQLEIRRVTTNALPLEAKSTLRQPTSFIWEGEKQPTKREPSDTSSLIVAQDPTEIAAINLRPDLSSDQNPADASPLLSCQAVDEAYKRKKLHYANLAAEEELESVHAPSGGGMQVLCMVGICFKFHHWTSNNSLVHS